jgi:hypothetical protein
LRFDVKARRLPSGLQAGEPSDALFVVSRRGAPPASGMVQTSPFERFSSMS